MKTKYIFIFVIIIFSILFLFWYSGANMLERTGYNAISLAIAIWASYIVTIMIELTEE